MSRQRNAGVTLLEMLTVLTVLAVITGSALTLLPVRGPSSSDVLATLADDLDRAAKDNIVRATGMTVAWTADSYRITVGRKTITGAWPIGEPVTATSEPPFLVSALGVPERMRSLVLTHPDGVIVFDGISARREASDAAF